MFVIMVLPERAISFVREEDVLKSEPSLASVPEFMALRPKLIDRESGWSGAVETWRVPYLGDRKRRGFELYGLLSGKPGPCVVFLTSPRPNS